MPQNIILEAKNLSFSYSTGKKVLSDINLQLHRGEIFTILGANGAGKSTLLNCLSNMLVPETGEILLNGRPISAYPTNEAAKIMGYVPQISVPTFSYSVRDYVAMGRAPHMGLLNVPGWEEYAKADQILGEMGISYLAGKNYSRISGGERQQAQIVRVLVQESDIILLDEPTNHLDYGNQLKIINYQLTDDQAKLILAFKTPDGK